jgi:hypothetical protein
MIRSLSLIFNKSDDFLNFVYSLLLFQLLPQSLRPLVPSRNQMKHTILRGLGGLEFHLTKFDPLVEILPHDHRQMILQLILC